MLSSPNRHKKMRVFVKNIKSKIPKLSIRESKKFKSPFNHNRKKLIHSFLQISDT